MWYYNEAKYNETPDDYQGFVYVITELGTNKKYIGKKNFWRPKVLPKNSKRNRRVRRRVPGDWEEYCVLNKELQLLVDEGGQDSYKREI